MEEIFDLYCIFINTAGEVSEVYQKSGFLSTLKGEMHPPEKYKIDLGGCINDHSIKSNDYFEEIRDQDGLIACNSYDLFEEIVSEVEPPVFEYQGGIVVC